MLPRCIVIFHLSIIARPKCILSGIVLFPPICQLQADRFNFWDPVTQQAIRADSLAASALWKAIRAEVRVLKVS